MNVLKKIRAAAIAAAPVLAKLANKNTLTGMLGVLTLFGMVSPELATAIRDTVIAAFFG